MTLLEIRSKAWQYLKKNHLTLLGLLFAVLALPFLAPYCSPPVKPEKKTTYPKESSTNKNGQPLDLSESTHTKSPLVASAAKVKINTITTQSQAQITSNLQKQATSSHNTVYANSSNVAIGNSGVVNQSIVNEFPEPKFHLKTIKDNVSLADIYVTELVLTVDHKAPLKNLFIGIKYPFLLYMNVSPTRSSAVITGNTNIDFGDKLLEGYGFINILNAWGSYLIQIKSSKPLDRTNFKINVVYE